jgi:hypothetical protein
VTTKAAVRLLVISASEKQTGQSEHQLHFDVSSDEWTIRYVYVGEAVLGIEGDSGLELVVREEGDFPGFKGARRVEAFFDEQLADAFAAPGGNDGHFGEFVDAVVLMNEGGAADDGSVVFGEVDHAPVVDDGTAGVVQHLNVVAFEEVVLFQPCCVDLFEVCGVVVGIRDDIDHGSCDCDSDYKKLMGWGKIRG